MRKLRFSFALTLLALVFLTGCGGMGGSGGGGRPGQVTTPVTLTLRDDPPAGVTLLSFKLDVTGAALQPGNISLLESSEPVQIELTQLQTEAAFLGTVQVPTGNYTSLSLTFANPELTIMNNSTATIGTCAVGAICELKPAISPMQVSFSGPPFPVALTMGMPAGFEVDVNLAKVIQMDLSVNLGASGAVNVTQLSVSPTSDELEELDVTGTVSSIGNNQFMLKTANGNTLTINIDPNTTKFDFEEDNCVKNDFSCLAVGQSVEVEVSILRDGSLLAKKVEFMESPDHAEIHGIVVAVNSDKASNSFEIVLHEEMPKLGNLVKGSLAVGSIGVGRPLTVTIQNGATFLIDTNGFSIPPGASFASSSDLLVGQEVALRIVGSPVIGPSISIMTDRLELRASEITATVGTINAGNSSFTLTNLPGLFTDAKPTSITQIQVLTSSQTQFKDLNPASFAGLVAGNPVSVEGSLFNTIVSTGSPTLVAEKIQGHNPS